MDCIHWSDDVCLSGCARPDYCSYCVTDNRIGPSRRKQLQLGWIVSSNTLPSGVITHLCTRAYLLGAATLSPLYGKLSDAVGRKPCLFASISLFLVASALCGAAQNMTWLIVCRAVQGIGGGGIIQLVQITISDIVSLEE